MFLYIHENNELINTDFITTGRVYTDNIYNYIKSLRPSQYEFEKYCNLLTKLGISKQEIQHDNNRTISFILSKLEIHKLYAYVNDKQYTIKFFDVLDFLNQIKDDNHPVKKQILEFINNIKNKVDIDNNIAIYNNYCKTMVSDFIRNTLGATFI